MATLPIVLVPNTILRTKSRAIALDKKALQFAVDLVDTLAAKKNPKGVGLSMPQIGKNWNIFVTWLHPSDVEKEPTITDMQLFINPQIIDTSAEQTFGDDPENPILEGCLSIPGMYGPVPRYESVTVSYTTLANREFVDKTATFSGFAARVVQHEYDHLQGVLFTDYSIKFDLPVYEYRGKKMVEIDKAFVASF